MAKIAIVGTRESGKTVLMTVLAKRYQNRNGDEPFLKAMNPQTMAFTEKNWHRLTVERDWPPLTPPGDLLKLHWSLECGGQSHEIHLVDFAGETFRTVFGKHTLTEPQVRSQLGADPLYGPLLAYLDQADVVVLLVNLRDYVNAPATAGGMDLMLENQWALRGSLDYLAPRLNNHVAAVFTQIDQYAELVNNCKSWRDVMGEHLPATQIADIYPDIRCLGVSAIPETELDASPGGEPFQRPAANFTSWHLEDLVQFFNEACMVAKSNNGARSRAALLLGAVFAIGGIGLLFSGQMILGSVLIFATIISTVKGRSVKFPFKNPRRAENRTTRRSTPTAHSCDNGIVWKVGRISGTIIGKLAEVATKRIELNASASQEGGSTPLDGIDRLRRALAPYRLGRVPTPQKGESTPPPNASGSSFPIPPVLKD